MALNGGDSLRGGATEDLLVGPRYQLLYAYPENHAAQWQVPNIHG